MCRPSVETTTDCSPYLAPDTSGNITQIGTRKYAYDWLNRLAAEWDGGVGTAYGYDGFGNMNMQTITTTSGAAPATGGNYDGVAFRTRMPISVDSATNRLNNATFDAAGNATALPDGRTFEWDSAGAMHALHAAGRDVVYLYTADDERVASVARIPAANLVDVNNRTTWTLRGASNQLLRTWVDDTTSGSRVWSWSEDEIWRGSTLLATESLTGTRHVFTDHLGSPRFMTNGAGQPLGTIAFSSFGQGGATGMGSLQFTGHERDLGATSTDALDYMHARYYSASLGRFLSVDPVLDLKRSAATPQAWNRYSYVVNNPIRSVDLDGREDTEIQLLWHRFKHVVNNHIDKLNRPGKSKFSTDSSDEVKAMVRETVKPANLVEAQANGRNVYSKEFDVAVGTRGETTVEVATLPTEVKGTETVVTAYPKMTVGTMVLNAVGLIGPLFRIYAYGRDFEKKHGRSPSFPEVAHYMTTGDGRSNEQLAVDSYKRPSL